VWLNIILYICAVTLKQYIMKDLLEEEPLFICNSCHEHFPREEMDFDVDEDQDLCKTCNYQSYNEGPYG
jgi:formylmethanofuran dehydrogenase subunit E